MFKTDRTNGVEGFSMAAEEIQGGLAKTKQPYKEAFDRAASGQYGQILGSLDSGDVLNWSFMRQLIDCS